MKPSRPQHVVILVENLPVPFDRRPWQISQALVRHGHRVSVICPQMFEYTREFERLEGVDIYRYPHPEAQSAAGYFREYLNALLWMSWICFKLFLTRGIDAIHACNPPDLLFFVALPYKLFFRTKFIFDHHDLAPEVYRAKFNKMGLAFKALCFFERLSYVFADVVLVTNESFRRIGMQRSGIASRKIFTVRNAPQRGRLVVGPAKQELKQGKKHLVGYLGVMNKQDGVDLLVESARHVIKTHGRSDVMFALIGDGDQLPALKQQAHENQLNGEMQFLGRISDGARISDYLNTATLCVCPDPKNDMNDHSTMTKVVEYMALGKPIVAYDLAESIHSAGDAAAYATNNDPGQFAQLIVELLDDEPRRSVMGAKGKARFDAELSWERSQQNLLNAYERVLSD